MHYAVTRHADVPYRRWHSLDDLRLADRLPPAAASASSATGAPATRAQAVLARLAIHAPQILVRLGNIYYSCTTAEANLFHDNARIVGAEDRLTPVALSREIRARVPGATLHVIPACGHLPSIERPDATAALLGDFLDRR